MINLSNKRVHFIGIGGISMSALAVLSNHKGAIVTGSDITKSRITDKLDKLGITVYYGHEAKNVLNSDIVVYSPAIHSDNVEYTQAQKLGLLLVRRDELLAEIASEYQNVITIAGSHGKTTTTAMVSMCFLDAGLEPTIHIGGELNSINGNVYVGQKYFFISEACEYVDSFLKFKNQKVSCVLNVQSDHMDYFKNIDNLHNSFLNYLKNTSEYGFCVLNNDDEFIKKINSNQNQITYAIKDKKANYRAANIRECKFSKYSFDILENNKKVNRIKLSVTGKHQIYNALACYTICKIFGISDDFIKKSLENFSGVKRRFEEVGYINGAKVIHDYAHHPTEIKANIMATKKFVKGKLFIVFQPHTFTRTRELWSDFKECFLGADHVVIYKIYPAREKEIMGIDAENLSFEINKTGVYSKAINDYNELYNYLKMYVNKNDIVLILGAGDIENFCKLIK